MGLANMELGEVSGVGDMANPPSRWDKLCNQLADVFYEPGIPPKRSVRHRIDVMEGSKPPTQHQYRISPTELAEVRR